MGSAPLATCQACNDPFQGALTSAEHVTVLGSQSNDDLRQTASLSKPFGSKPSSYRVQPCETRCNAPQQHDDDVMTHVESDVYGLVHSCTIDRKLSKTTHELLQESSTPGYPSDEEESLPSLDTHSFDWDTCVSLFKLCKATSDAQKRRSVIKNYVGSAHRSFAKVLSAQGLHRGVFISTLVNNFGGIFREGSAVVVYGKNADDQSHMERWYCKSGPPMGPEQMLAGFISHSWATSGFQKGVALSMYFLNRRASSVMFLFVMLVGVPIVVSLKISNMEQNFMFVALVFVALASYLCYFFLLFFGSIVPFFLHGMNNDRYFLDICCISQHTDQKMNGVYHLAEYVMVSKKVIVCYTERYTTRLWCVFEMAVFFSRLRRLANEISPASISKSWIRKAMQHKHAAEFVFLPLFLPPIAIAISLSMQAWICLLIALLMFDVNLLLVILNGCCFVLTLALIAFAARSLHKAALKMHNDFKTFSVDNAKCFSEEDRSMILTSIESFWNSGTSDSENDGVKEFELFVREDVAAFIHENFVSSVGALRCLFANSQLLVVQLALVFAGIGAMVPFLMVAYIADDLVGDSYAITERKLLSLRERITCKRLLIWFLMLVMATFCAVHCMGYCIEPEIEIPDDGKWAFDPSAQGYPKEYMARFKQSLLVPNEYVMNASPSRSVMAAGIGVVSLFFLISILNAVFLRRHAVLGVLEDGKPAELESLSAKSVSSWAIEWLRYVRRVTKPGAKFYWRRVRIMEFVELALQIVKLATYSGMDMYSGESVPANDDKVVLFHTCVICFDLVSIGLCIYFRAVFAAIASETITDILYTVTPVAALGAFAQPAAWYALRDDDAPVISFFTTLFPMLRSLSTLSQLDQMNLQHYHIVRRSTLSQLDQKRPSAQSSDSKGGRSFSASVMSFSAALHQLEVMASRGLQEVYNSAGVEGRQKGIIPFLELVLRLAIAIGLLSWVLLAMSHSCEMLDGGDGWRCDWITHPIFESPSCDCKILSGQAWTVQSNDNETFTCIIDRIYPLVHVATRLEYLFIRGNPALFDCSFDEDRFSRFDNGWLKHMRGIQWNAALMKATKLPQALSEAKQLRLLHVYFSQIVEIPVWFTNFQYLQNLRILLGQIQSVPVVLTKLPKLNHLDLDGNPVCYQTDADFRAHGIEPLHYEYFSCGVSYEGGTQNGSENMIQNDVLCSAYGGLWNAAGGFKPFCAEPATAECTGLCQVFLAYVSPLDFRPPRGAYDVDEINSDLFQNILKTWLGSYSRLNSSQQLQCSLNSLQCQTEDIGVDRSQLWLTTFARMVTRAAGIEDEISDCSECSGTASLAYYSLELQDPQDDTKPKR